MEPTNHVKYLGLYLDENLSWSVHINQLSKKLSRSNVILSKVRPFFYLKEQLYPYITQFFYSHLLYGFPVWSLATENMLNTITDLQKQCVRIMNVAPFNRHTNDLFV